MTDRWIEIENTGYCLKGDRMCWTVSRKVACKKSPSFPSGFKHTDLTYHTTLTDVFRRIFEESIRISEYKSIQELLRIVEQTHQLLKKTLDRDFKSE